MTRLLIARHGNTFEKGESPRRVGGRTDIPLVHSGVEQAQVLGLHLDQQHLRPDVVFCAPLKRTRQTAEGVMAAMGSDAPMIILDAFKEIDYGLDENLTEEQVVGRIGQQAIDDWNRLAVVPEGWNVNPAEMINTWREFGQMLIDDYASNTVLVVTSNGIARFAPHLTDDFEAFAERHSIKVGTGAYCLLEHDGTCWRVLEWNVKPSECTR